MLDFIDNWTIDLSKLPSYDDFKAPFTVPFDKQICNMLVSGVNPKVTNIMISSFKNNVLPHIRNDNTLTVLHNNRYGLGRFYSNQDLSPCCHTKYIKNRVFSYQDWLEIDMHKGHSSILRHLNIKSGRQSQTLDDVVLNWKTKWVEIAEYYKNACGVKLDEDNIKYYFNMTIYGGGYKLWIDKLKDEKDAEKHGHEIKEIPQMTPIHPFMATFKWECERISKLVYEGNPEIVRLVCEGKTEEYEKKNATMSYFCGIVENHIVYFVYKFLVKNKGIIPFRCLLEMDGICLPRLDGVDYDDLIAKVNAALQSYEISFKIKLYEKYSLQDIIKQRRAIIAPTPLLIDTPSTSIQNQPIEYLISLEDLADVYKTSGIITKTLKTTLVLCTEEWFMLDNKTQLWRKQKEPSFYVITEIRKYIDYSNKKIVEKIATVEGKEKEDLIEISKKYLNSYNRVNQPSYFTVLIKLLRPQLTDDTFTSKLDNNAGMLAFKNGIYDLKENSFREGILPSDFITDTIPFNYEIPDNTKTKYLREKLKEIMNNNDEHLEFWLSILGYSFIGNAHLEKAFYCCIDGTDLSKGDNGKTLFYEILTILFPCYVYKSDCSLIENDNKKAHKQLVRTKGKRLVWVDEYKQNKRADYTLLKQLAEGKTKENEVMFGTTETLKFMFKLFVLSNHKFTIPPAEEAVYNRYNEIPFTSHFDRTGKTTTPNPDTLEFIADVTLLDKIVNEYKNEVAGLIIEYGHKYYMERLPSMPSFFKSKTMETRKHNDSFIDWFENNCEVCDSGKVPLKVLLGRYVKGEAELKEGMKRLGFKYNKELKGMGKDENNKYYKGGYEGLN